MNAHMSVASRFALVALTAVLGACSTTPPVSDDQSTPQAHRAPAELATTFQVWDLHARGTDPKRSVKVIDPNLAQRGYWVTSAFMGMPRREADQRMGAGGAVIAEADLAERQRVFERRIAETGISRLSGLVMLDAEAFMPYESAQTLEWYNRTARVASTHFDNWFWYFQPHRFNRASMGGYFSSEEEYFDWYAQQEFIQRASAIGVVVYHGRERDAANPISAAGRTRDDKYVQYAIEFGDRVGKPIFVIVRADLAGKPRETIMTREALEASWRELFLDPRIDGIAIWNDQPEDMIDFDRRWARERIEPVIRALQSERSVLINRQNGQE